MERSMAKAANDDMSGGHRDECSRREVTSKGPIEVGQIITHPDGQQMRVKRVVSGGHWAPSRERQER
jgi:hypothetical protein